MTKPKALNTRDKLAAALATHGTPGPKGNVIALLLLVGQMLLEFHAETTAQFHHLERRLDQMAVDTSKFAADLAQMASDLDEIKTGIATLVANAASNGEAAAQAEADQLTGQLDTAAAALREAASQFDPAAVSAKKK